MADVTQASGATRLRTASVKRARDERGQAAFEFLLILPLFIVFVLLLVDFGILMYGYVSVANGAREGARFAAVNCNDGSCTDAEVESWAAARSSGFASATEVTATWAVAPSVRGSAVVVRVTRPHNFLFMPAVQIPITSCAQMRLEERDNNNSLPTTPAQSCQ